MTIGVGSLICLILIIIGASHGKDAVATYYLWRIRNNTAYMIESLESRRGTWRRAAVKEYLLTSEGEHQLSRLVLEWLPGWLEELDNHQEGLHILISWRMSACCLVVRGLQTGRQYSGKDASPCLVDAVKRHLLTAGGNRITLPEHASIAFTFYTVQSKDACLCTIARLTPATELSPEEQ